MARRPDVVVTATTPPGASIGAGLAGDATRSDFTSGNGAWVSVDRPRRTPYLEFASIPLYQLEVPLIVDSSDQDTSIEPALATLVGWRRVSSTGQPPILSISGPVDTAGIVGWVLQTLAWTDPVIRRRDGARTQQGVTLTLLEAVDGTTSTTAASRSPANTAAAQLPFPFKLLTPQLQALASSYSGNLAELAARFAPQLSALQTYVAAHGSDLSALANAVPQLQVQVRAELANLAAVLPTVLGGMPQHVGGHRTTVVRPGDNLESIANRELGDYRKWTAIALLNGIRDPNKVNAGQTLRLP